MFEELGSQPDFDLSERKVESGQPDFDLSGHKNEGEAYVSGKVTLDFKIGDMVKKLFWQEKLDPNLPDDYTLTSVTEGGNSIFTFNSKK